MKSTIQTMLRALRRALSIHAGEGTWISPYEFVAFETTPSREASSSATEETVQATSYVQELGGTQRMSDRELEEFLATDRQRTSAKSAAERAA